MRVLLVPNVGNPVAVSSAVELSAWLAAQGIDATFTPKDASACGVDSSGETAPGEDTALVVALGGDGTILKAARIIGGAEIPILGVNMGRLGFLSGAGPEHMREAISDALAGDVRVERRATLRVGVGPEGDAQDAPFALNEVVVGRAAAARVVAMDVRVSGEPVMSFRADGVIVATATGSTAYAMSAGGPIVAPDFSGMIVIPVAPHTLSTRPIVTSPADVVEVVLTDPTRAEACVTIDGDELPCEDELRSIRVARAEHDVLLVRHDGAGFYKTLARQFFGG